MVKQLEHIDIFIQIQYLWINVYTMYIHHQGEKTSQILQIDSTNKNYVAKKQLLHKYKSP